MTSKSVISFASSLSSSQPELSLGIFENRKFKVGTAYFSEGSYEQAAYYFKRFLDSVERSYAPNDDRTIMANEKLADADCGVRTCLQPYPASKRGEEANKSNEQASTNV